METEEELNKLIFTFFNLGWAALWWQSVGKLDRLPSAHCLFIAVKILERLMNQVWSAATGRSLRIKP